MESSNTGGQREAVKEHDAQRELLAGWLAAASEELQGAVDAAQLSGQLDAGAMRTLEKRLSRLWVMTSDGTSSIVCFFLPLLVKDIFANLFGDTPFCDEVVDARLELAAAFATALGSMAEALSEEDGARLVSGLGIVTNAYRDGIATLNAQLEGRSRYECA